MPKRVDIFITKPKEKNNSPKKKEELNKVEQIPQSKLKTKIKQLCTKCKKSSNPKQHRRTKIIFVFCALIVIVAIATVTISIYHATHQPIQKEFFVSDDSKTVIPLSSSSEKSSRISDSHIQTFLVYTLDGEKVTGLKTYFEYADNESAAAIIDSLRTQPEFKDATLDGKYIIVSSPPEQYEGMTASDVNQQTNAIREYYNNIQQK